MGKEKLGAHEGAIGNVHFCKCDKEVFRAILREDVAEDRQANRGLSLIQRNLYLLCCFIGELTSCDPIDQIRGGSQDVNGQWLRKFWPH